jgi:hypothetical protein
MALSPIVHPQRIHSLVRVLSLFFSMTLHPLQLWKSIARFVSVVGIVLISCPGCSSFVSSYRMPQRVDTIQTI